MKIFCSIKKKTIYSYINELFDTIFDKSLLGNKRQEKFKWKEIKKWRKKKKISNLARKITREFYNLQKKAPTSKIYINIELIMKIMIFINIY